MEPDELASSPNYLIVVKLWCKNMLPNLAVAYRAIRNIKMFKANYPIAFSSSFVVFETSKPWSTFVHGGKVPYWPTQ